MTSGNPPRRAPTASELLADPVVQAAIAQAWIDSQPSAPPGVRHEEGGWIYLDLTTSQVSVHRATPGIQDEIDLNRPPHVLGAIVVGKFHTHPNPASEGWVTGPKIGRASCRERVYVEESIE